jgi:hypothetical protein
MYRWARYWNPTWIKNAFKAQSILRISSFFLFWHNSPQWATAYSFVRFLYHIQWHSTVDRLLWTSDQLVTLPKHKIHNRQTSMPPLGFEPTISAGERPQTYALDRPATAIDTAYIKCFNIKKFIWIPNRISQARWLL